MADENSAFSIARYMRKSLSTRLLAMTILFVLFAELVVLIPSIAKQRVEWLDARLDSAYLVGLALDAPGGEMIEPEIAVQLFKTANILGVTINQDGARMPIMTPKLTEEQTRVMRYVNIDHDQPLAYIKDAWATLFSTGDHSIRVVGTPKFEAGGKVDMFVSQAALRRDLQIYARNVLLLSLIISTVTATLVYLSLSALTVRPIRRLTSNMMAFERAPEDPANIVKPSKRIDEIGGAERGLATLETRLQALLNERRRLAALGAGISKISHDLRNILASAQLMSDRLAKSEDPRVRKLSPRLISSLDRAIALSRDTLSYARMESSALKKETIDLQSLVDEIIDDSAAMNVALINDVPENCMINADPTQLYRAVFNLVKNAVEAFGPPDDNDTTTPRNRVTIAAHLDGPRAVIDIEDNGPGIPEAARESLFEPFKGSFKPGGSGLGVAIAHEIASAHHGELVLVSTSETGSHFRFHLPL